MVAVVPASEVHHAIDRLRMAGRQARRIGEVIEGRGRVHVEPGA
jgi:hydrogenase maturation factor